MSDNDDPVLAVVESLRDTVQALEADVRAAGVKEKNGGIYLPRWAAGVLGTLLVSALVALTATILNVRTDVEIIKSNRFSSQDWIVERRELLRNIPPPDVLRRLLDHERRLERLENR